MSLQKKEKIFLDKKLAESSSEKWAGKARKMYEIDKVPFFKYITYDYVNKSIQVPHQGIAPFIDYTNSEFSFIDNIDMGLDNISPSVLLNPVSSQIFIQ